MSDEIRVVLTLVRDEREALLAACRAGAMECPELPDNPRRFMWRRLADKLEDAILAEGVKP